MSWIEYDPALIEDIAARFDLRVPNKQAVSRIIEMIHTDGWHEVLCDLATGVGKTYILVALIDYLAIQGTRNVLIVTPGQTIQNKTIANFTPGHPKFVSGAEYHPVLITAENFARGQVGDALHDPDALKVFVFNVQQLIRPTVNISRRVRELDEFIGSDLYSHLQLADDLVVIADEHHIYRTQAVAFSNAIRGLGPRALVGLTATPDKADLDKVIFRYSLAEAIADGLVKIPVIVYREDGHKDIKTQLADACHLLRVKAAAMSMWAAESGESQINPALFVVCQTIEDADDTARVLAGDGYIGDVGAVLLITSQSSDEALRALQQVEEPESPIRAVVSVDKLKEGWDVKNIGVIVALRKLASQSLTEQILGRGLRLPYGRRVGVPMIDTVDLVAHDSYQRLLADKDALLERVMPADDGSGASIPGTCREPSERQGAKESYEQGILRLITPPRVIDGEEVDGTAALIIASFDNVVEQGAKDRKEIKKTLAPVSGAPVIEFPRREREVLPVRFTLSFVSDIDARATGAAFATEIEVPLVRRAITATRGLDGEVIVRQEAQQSEIATQQELTVDKVRSDLESRVLSLGLVESTLPEVRGAERVVKAFLEGAGVQEDDDVWWEEARALQATSGLANLIRDRYNTRRLQPEYGFRTVRVPVYPKPMPSDVIDRFKGNFERGRWYSGWTKSILPVASFDAKTTEFALASILDSSTRIKWWLRLRKNDDPAYVELDNGKKYYPDFIAIDDENIYWLIEGKSDHDARREDVRAKKSMAEEWARFVNDNGHFGRWRYLFATERMIKRATNSWDVLLVQAKPE
jgi:type III restriction enzyme